MAIGSHTVCTARVTAHGDQTHPGSRGDSNHSELAISELTARPHRTPAGTTIGTPTHRLRNRIGRYAIEGVLGAGGMAVVYLARDPVLGRAVALKVLRVDGDEDGAQRLVREGQALARVSHPNVISVYEVGRETDGLIYIAMERIVGTTLAEWLDVPRTPEAVLAVFAAAGRGLAAAHAAGLVHRDFKPENVMVGDDGRVCVLDFGLALAAADSAGDPAAIAPDAAAAARCSLLFGATLDISGASAVGLRAESIDSGLQRSKDRHRLAGTPAYMSPEQWRGDRASVRSDQFGFCVALWSALGGEHPFDTSSRTTLRADVIAGRIRRAPTGLPRRLRSVLRRGLSPDPRARFGSLDAVVAQLAAPPRRAWIAPSLVAAAAAIAGAVVLSPGTAPAHAIAEPAAAAAAGHEAVHAAARLAMRGKRTALSWSPDGRQLALVAPSAGGARGPGLVVIDIATGEVRRLGPIAELGCAGGAAACPRAAGELDADERAE